MLMIIEEEKRQNPYSKTKFLLYAHCYIYYFIYNFGQYPQEDQ